MMRTNFCIVYTYLRVDGRPAIQMANNDIIKLAKSVSKWAASVAIAKLFDITPPTTSRHMNTKHKILAIMSFLRACLSIPSVCPLSVWQCSEMQPGNRVIKIYDSTATNRSTATSACIHTYFRFVSTPKLVHCRSNSLTNVRVNNRQWSAIHLVSMCRTIYCHMSWNETKSKLIGKKLETLWFKTLLLEMVKTTERKTLAKLDGEIASHGNEKLRIK